MASTGAQLAPSYAPTRSRGGVYHPRVRPSRVGLTTEGSSARVLRPEGEVPAISRQLHVVDGDKKAIKASGWSFLFLALVVAVVAIVLPLVLNTQMAQRSYDIRDLQVELAELQAQTSSLEADLLEASSSVSLEAKARELGLVPAQAPGVISLEQGTVEGGISAW